MALEEVGAGWIKESKNGRKFVSLKISVAIDAGESLMLFRQQEKKSERAPDYSLCRHTEEAAQPQQPQARPAPVAQQQRPQRPQARPAAADSFDDVPF